MTIAEKQKVLDVLNSLEVIETGGGDDAYILVDNTEENRKRLNEVGISDETVNKYGDENAFCILALAFSEGYCDLYNRGKLIVFDKSIEVEVEKGESIILYKHDGGIYLTLSKDGGEISTVELSDEQLQEISSVIA